MSLTTTWFLIYDTLHITPSPSLSGYCLCVPILTVWKWSPLGWGWGKLNNSRTRVDEMDGHFHKICRRCSYQIQTLAHLKLDISFWRFYRKDWSFYLKSFSGGFCTLDIDILVVILVWQYWPMPLPTIYWPHSGNRISIAEKVTFRAQVLFVPK